MKFDLSTQLVDLDGQPATQTTATGYDENGKAKGFKEVPLTLGLVLKTAFNTQSEKDKETSLEKLIQRGKWIMSINKGVSPDFKVEEQAEIKTLCRNAGFTPIVLVQIDELIEKKGK
jgi:hypothetical protein